MHSFLFVPIIKECMPNLGNGNDEILIFFSTPSGTFSNVFLLLMVLVDDFTLFSILLLSNVGFLIPLEKGEDDEVDINVGATRFLPLLRVTALFSIASFFLFGIKIFICSLLETEASLLSF